MLVIACQDTASAVHGCCMLATRAVTKLILLLHLDFLFIKSVGFYKIINDCNTKSDNF